MFPSSTLPVILFLCIKAFIFVFVASTDTQEKNTHFFLLGKGSTRTTQNTLRMSNTFWTTGLFWMLSFSPHIFHPCSQGVKLTYKGSAFLCPNLKQRGQNSQARDVLLSSSEASQTNRQEKAAIHGTNKWFAFPRMWWNILVIISKHAESSWQLHFTNPWMFDKKRSCFVKSSKGHSITNHMNEIARVQGG